MLERLRGSLEELKADHVIIGTSSFSYRVNVSLRTIQEMPKQGTDVLLYLHPVYKENDITLYGFDSEEDREIFRELISVSKVGPKTALNILSLYNRNEIIRIIAGGKSKDLTRAQGLGKKSADMIIAQLKDKYSKMVVVIDEEESEEGGAVEKLRESDEAFSDAMAALTSLGYSWEVASEAITKSYEPGIPLEALIKAALLNMNG